MLLKLIRQLRAPRPRTVADAAAGGQQPLEHSAAPELDSLLAQAVGLQAAGSHQGALDCYARALPLALAPQLSAAVLCNMGAANQALVRLGAAADCYRRALQLAPDLAEAHYNLGCLWYDMGRIDEA